MRLKKEVRAPVRIDFAGGTTDIKPFSTDYGGAVLNAAINRYVIGKLIATDKSVGLEYHSSIPTSSGLGSSGVMNLVWLALISQYKDKIKLAENVYNLEQATGLVGGKQDQYASAIGGINFFEFKNHGVKINKLNLSKKLIDELEKRLVLVYTGPHYSGMLNKLAIGNLLKGKNTKNLLEIKKTAYEMKKALEKSNLDKFADLMNVETEERKKLHSSIVPLRLEKFISMGKKNGAVSAKICGAGGGGSILFFADDRKKLIRKFKNRIIDFKFDFQGLKFS